MRKQRKPRPAPFDLTPIAPFVETNTDLPKSALIERIAGKVNYSFLTLMKMLQFYTIGKDEKGELYLY
jgi:hypothetical protein